MNPVIESPTLAPIKLNLLQRTRARLLPSQVGDHQQKIKETLDLGHDLLQASIGSPKLDEAPSATQKREVAEYAYLKYIEGRLKQISESTVEELLFKGPDAEDPSHERLLKLITQVIERFRNGSNFSIDGHHNGLIQYLIISDVLDERCAAEANNAARQLIFALIGWTFMFYMPQPKYNDRLYLRIQNDGLSCFEMVVQPLDTCEGSFLELVCGFGKVFPWKEQPRASSDSELSDQLLTASLNVSTLIKQFNITVKWVTCFSAHLDFDVARRQLSLFCLPSFSVLHECDESALEHFLNNFHSAAHRPPTFSVTQIMHEIILSYELLFRNNPQARRNYAHTQRDAIKTVLPEGVDIDPTLDRLCGLGQLKQSIIERPHKSSFSKAVDFPVFAERLSQLQDFIGKQQSSSLNALWNDHRDFNALYTFRAVLVFGTLGICMALIGVALQSVQTAYTIMAYQGSQVSQAVG